MNQALSRCRHALPVGLKVVLQKLQNKATQCLGATLPNAGCGLWRAVEPTSQAGWYLKAADLTSFGPYSIHPYAIPVATHLIFGSLPPRDGRRPQTTSERLL